MSFIVNEEVERYALEHSTPDPEFFRRLEQETRDDDRAPDDGRAARGAVPRLARADLAIAERPRDRHLHRLLVDLDGLALPDGGRITSLDVNEETTAVARRYAEEAGVADRIDYRVGPALDALAELEGPGISSSSTPTSRTTSTTTRPCCPSWSTTASSSPTTSSGRAGRRAGRRRQHQAIKAFNDHVAADDRVEQLMLTVRDGMTLIRRRPA